MKNLLIVESPAKAKTLNKFLGKDFVVKASIGHVRDLPENEMGIDIDKNFSPKYIIIPGKEKIIKELKDAAQKARMVFLAPDPDREGEAIAWHIAEILKDGRDGKDIQQKIKRVSFNEITEQAVKRAIENPGPIDMNKVHAQQARRILDRLVGYELSPLLWKKIKRGLSAGRVQSVALKFVVERERQIQSFKPKEYWSITGIFSSQENRTKLEAKLHKYEDNLIINRSKEEFFIQNSKEAEALVRKLKKLDYILAEIQRKTRKRNPPAPFITSTLQQEASRRLGFTPKKTMLLAQQLYEGVELGEEGPVGLITYMRTDSTRVAEEAVEAARQYIQQNFGKDYIAKGATSKKKTSKGKIQDAHEAIRPTYLDKPPEQVKPYLSRDLYRLYKLIWDRFIASQMAPAEIAETVYVIKDSMNKAEFRATGQTVKFYGFMKLYTATEEPPEDTTLPELKKNQVMNLQELKPEQHFTQPPARYTEASLVKALEEKGIGRPSTYATIISTIQERKYVVKKDGRLYPTELGLLVNDYLVHKFPELINESFTARMEADLDKVENGTQSWLKIVKAFYKPFKKDLDQAYSDKDKAIEDQPTELVCEICGKNMVKRWGKHGWFYACTGFPECKNTKPIKTETSEQNCPACGAQMVVKQGRYGRFLACSRYPECKTTMPFSTGVICPVDGGQIVEKTSKKGKTFWSCSNWPDCKFALWHKPVPVTCPECGHPFLIEKHTKKKSFYQCPNKKCSFKTDQLLYSDDSKEEEASAADKSEPVFVEQ